MKRLEAKTFHLLAGEEPKEGEPYKRKAILVHAGVFQSQDGEIEFDAARLNRVVANQNALRGKMESEYGGNVPVGAWPAILDSHEDGSNDNVIGRLMDELAFEVRDIPMVGKAVPCITSMITFLGNDSIEKAKDGRIYHISIGINEEDNLLTETSTVRIPAAPGAMLLKKGTKRMSGDKKEIVYKGYKISIYLDNGPNGTSKWVAEIGDGVIQSESEADALAQAKKRADEFVKKEKSGKLSKKRTIVKNLNLSQNTKKGASSMSNIAKRLAANQVKIARLKALVAESDSLKAKAEDAKTLTLQKSKEFKVTARLSGLMKSGKMTPAEYKKLEIKKLAALGSDAFEMVMSAFDAREVVIDPAQRGSTSAVDAVDVRRNTEASQFKRLKDEARADIARLQGKKHKKLAAGDDEDEKEPKKKDKEMSQDDEEADKKMAAEHDKHMAALGAALEKGDHDGAKEHFGNLKKCGPKKMGYGMEGDGAAQEQEMGGIQEQVDHLNVQMAKVSDELKKLLGEEEEEHKGIEKEMAQNEKEAEEEEEEYEPAQKK